MTVKVPREWQTDAFNKWAEHSYVGCLKARTGSGKTVAGCLIMSTYHQMYPLSAIVVVTPSEKVCKQWRDEMSNYSLSDIQVMSYQKAINGAIKGQLKCDCLIADECHRLSPGKESAKVLSVLHPFHILGLSATPGGSINVLGAPFLTVDWEEANLCDFIVHYCQFMPNQYELAEYDTVTKKMHARATTVNGKISLAPGRDRIYDLLVRQRRDICYSFKSRIPHTVRLIETYKSKRIVVYTERLFQVRLIAKELESRGIPYSEFSDERDTLADFENKCTNVLILCKKLREGWNDPSLEIEILCATTTNELQHTQVVGRVQRKDPNNPNKVAHIFVLLAMNTSDLNVLSKHDFPKNKVEVTTVQSVLDIAPGLTSRNKADVW